MSSRQIRQHPARLPVPYLTVIISCRQYYQKSEPEFDSP